VAFASAPDLHTAAHEAAHTIQQSRGAVGFQGLGAADDQHEHHADAVADAVVAGQSAEPLLDRLSGGGGTAVQRKTQVTEKEIADGVEASPFAAKRDRRVIDWRQGIQKRAIRDPSQAIECRFAETLEPRATAAAKEHARPGTRGPDKGRGLVEQGVGAWTAIKDVTAATELTHGAVAIEVAGFRDPQNDKDLAGMLLSIPQGGDLTQLTSQQQLPGRGGMKLHELFDEDETLTLSDQAYAAIHRPGGTKKKTDDAAVATTIADSALRQALLGFQASLEGVKVAHGELESAVQHLAAESATNDAADARDEIEALRNDTSDLKDAVDVFFSFLSGAAHIAAGEVGDAISSVGEVAGYLLSWVNHRNIAAVEQRLRKAEKQMKTARGKALSSMVEAKKSGLRRSIIDVEQSKERILQVNAERRHDYTKLGDAAASELDGNGESKQKLSAMLAAIPLVEMVTSRARAIVAKSQLPPYSEAAGHGLWLATTQGEQRVPAFLRAVGEIEGTRDIYMRVAMKWSNRLEQLKGLKQAVIGPRPGGK
ncbi:MAG: hypothetical protein H0T65_13030, partial [Deltaproteobacteria bacterium]|nr:hypothetical protein [Deltaproteobacteria bacterium]